MWLFKSCKPEHLARLIFLVAVSHRWFWAGTAIVGPAVQLSATDHDLTAAFGAECQCSGEGAVQTAERCQPPSTNIHSRSEEHTSAPVTNAHLVCRLLLEKKKF